jgi:hypothetical protein
LSLQLGQSLPCFSHFSMQCSPKKWPQRNDAICNNTKKVKFLTFESNMYNVPNSPNSVNELTFLQQVLFKSIFCHNNLRFCIKSKFI